MDSRFRGNDRRTGQEGRLNIENRVQRPQHAILTQFHSIVIPANIPQNPFDQAFPIGDRDQLPDTHLSLKLARYEIR